MAGGSSVGIFRQPEHAEAVLTRAWLPAPPPRGHDQALHGGPSPVPLPTSPRPPSAACPAGRAHSPSFSFR